MWEPYQVKAQTVKTAVEAATLLLRIDDIVRLAIPSSHACSHAYTHTYRQCRCCSWRRCSRGRSTAGAVWPGLTWLWLPPPSCRCAHMLRSTLHNVRRSGQLIKSLGPKGTLCVLCAVLQRSEEARQAGARAEQPAADGDRRGGECRLRADVAGIGEIPWRDDEYPFGCP